MVILICSQQPAVYEDAARSLNSSHAVFSSPFSGVHCL
jgi:hypothetical protein